MRIAPYQKELSRLDRLGVNSYQEFGGYIGPRYWKLTMPDGTITFACQVKTLRNIANELEKQ